MEENEEVLEEEEVDEIEELKKELITEMRKYDKCSKEYGILAQRLKELTECIAFDAQKKESNARARAAEEESKLSKLKVVSWIGPAIAQFLGTAATTALSYKMNRQTVNDILVHEDRGNILTTKSINQVKKPRD